MKKILSGALALILFTGAAQAQTTDEAQGRHHGKEGGMMKDLNLTPDQQSKIKSIREAEKKEMQGLKTGGTTGADKASRKELHQKYQTQLQSVLTEEQKAKMQDRMKNGKEAMSAKGGKREKEFGKDVNLTTDQKTKISSLNQDFKTKAQAIRNNSTLSAEEKKAQMKSLAQTHQTDMKAVLTPEQANKMKSLKKGKGNRDRNEII